MKKFLLGIVLLLSTNLFSLTSSAQEQDHIVYHSCDFSDGIPADYSTFDLDEQTLHYTMIQGGIKQGEAWARKKELGTQNYFAASACRYKEIDGVELKPSDDWLITPAIWVRGKDATLSWDAQSLKSQQKVSAGYRVLVSTTGNNPADFTQQPVFSTDEESLNEWTHHEIDLAQYEGQHIYIAFHNNSAQGDFLCIDNITVMGHRGICDMAGTTGSHVFGTELLNVSLAITSYADVPITDMTLYYRHNNETVTETLSGLNINKYEVYNHTFSTPIPIANGDTTQYTIGAIVNDIPQDEITYNTVAFLFAPAQKVVIEEITGMWCTFCPTGIVAFDILKEKYPEQFIGLALHYDDIIAVNDYVNAIGVTGLPSGWVNRRHYVTSPMVVVENNGIKEYVTTNGGFETYLQAELSSLSPCEVVINALSYNNNQVTLNTTTHSAIDIENIQYQLAFVVVEDHVWGEGYYQKNGYSGGEAKLHGWENRPKMVVDDFKFDHVVRCIYDNYQGIAGSIPSQLMAGEEHTSSYTFNLPSTILNPDNVKIVAMIINCADGSIVNAAESGSLTAINKTQASHKTQCFTAGNSIYISLPSNNPAHIAIYNLAGALVAAYDTNSTSLQIPAPNSGVYIVSITHNNCTSTHKIVVR